ncbi:uncharacterized protein LOC141528402 [Cotesia typhae]|uniref:uncharacterized protein LOC141528402 n=1 Tax=Cotesia typhae TaxID=2053667 RepID=UPI003D684333
MVKIKKKECINHVQKRMGSRLRALKKQRTNKKTKTGKEENTQKSLGGKGRLTDKAINEFTKYYGLAIRRHSNDVDEMYNAIWQTFYHKFSSPEDPQHFLCPEGANSWCQFQKAVATNTLDSLVEKPPLPADIAEALIPIYEDLSNPELLERCVGGFTQNNNESFNALVWQLAPKTNSSYSLIVEIALYISTITFNDGALATLKILENLDVKVGPTLYSYCAERDATRVKAAESRMETASKKKKKSRSILKIRRKNPHMAQDLIV